MKTLLSRAALAAAAMALGLPGAQATVAPGTLNVSLTVTGVCTVTSAALKFGAVTGQVDVDGFGFISITCGAGTSYTVALDNGAHYDNSTRRMETSDTLNSMGYELYSDISHLASWNSSTVITKTSAGTDQLNVYGHALAKGATPGTYTDAVSITVTY